MGELDPTCRRRNALPIGVALMAAAVILGAAVLAKGQPLGSAARIALAVVQGLATAACIVVSVRSIRGLDELQRKIQLEALAFAFVGTGILGAGYGFLQNAGLPAIDWGGILWPAMVGLWAVGFLVSNWRYR